MPDLLVLTVTAASARVDVCIATIGHSIRHIATEGRASPNNWKKVRLSSAGNIPK